MDTAVVVLLIVLVIVLGIFFLSGGGFGGNTARSTGYNSYPSQYSGGGCGRG